MTPAAPGAPGRATRPDEIATFLTEQAECLAAGLEHAEDPLAVRAVLRTHDGAHDRWLRCISTTASRDARAADELAALYALHGRVAGSLESARHRIPDRVLHGHVRDVLARQLRDATARVIAALPPV